MIRLASVSGALPQMGLGGVFDSCVLMHRLPSSLTTFLHLALSLTVLDHVKVVTVWSAYLRKRLSPTVSQVQNSSPEIDPVRDPRTSTHLLGSLLHQLHLFDGG